MKIVVICWLHTPMSNSKLKQSVDFVKQLTKIFHKLWADITSDDINYYFRSKKNILIAWIKSIYYQEDVFCEYRQL